MLTSWKKSYDQPRQHIKKQRHYFANKGPSTQSYGFSSSHVWMWELDYKESWTLKNFDASELWCWRRLLRVPWTTRRSNQSNLKEISPEYSLEGLMLKLKLQYFAKCWLLVKDPDAGKDWRQEEKGMTEDEMFGWHHRLDGHGFERAPGVGEGQGSLVCCSPWGCKESDNRATEFYWLRLLSLNPVYLFYLLPYSPPFWQPSLYSPYLNLFSVCVLWMFCHLDSPSKWDIVVFFFLGYVVL